MKPDAPVTPVSAEPSAQGVGATLKALREAKGLDLAAVSARLKFSTRQIEALEAENWALLPSGLPLRGLVKNYARLLDADSDAVITMLEASTSQANLPRKTLATGPAVRPVGTLQEETSSRGNWGWLFIILVLVLIAFFYALDRGWLPESWQFADWIKSVSNP